MEKHVLSDGIARLDAIRILSGLDRKKSNWITDSSTVFDPGWTDAAVCFLATAASTSRSAYNTNGHACNAERTRDFNARDAGKSTGAAVGADKEEIGRIEEVIPLFLSIFGLLIILKIDENSNSYH
jgi:hypothetical protein